MNHPVVLFHPSTLPSLSLDLSCPHLLSLSLALCSTLFSLSLPMPPSAPQNQIYSACQAVSLPCPTCEDYQYAHPPSTWGVLTGRLRRVPRSSTSRLEKACPKSWIQWLKWQSPWMLQLRRKDLVSAVMTTRAESRISHGLLVVRSWLMDQSADVALVSIVLLYHMYIRWLIPRIGVLGFVTHSIV
jgi:hypothetical protein